MILANSFQTGSTLHLITLAIIAAAAVLLTIATGYVGTKSRQRLLQRFVGWGCVAAWILNTGYWMMPERFDPAGSLPLHFCNAANIFGALAVLKGIRLFQGVLYFWTCLCGGAVLTPTVGQGPGNWGFWVFWIYHSFIIFALIHIFRCGHYRPSFRDLLQSALFTLACVILLSIVNALTGWNYGFLGNSVPGTPTPVDLLGPYPIRILWMILAGSLLFLLLWIPFRNYSTTRTRK